MRGRRRRAAAGTHAALVAVSLLWLAPVAWTIMASTKPLRTAFANPPELLYRPTFAAFSALWRQSDFAFYLEHTLEVAVISVAATLLLAAPAAYGLSRLDNRIASSVLALALFVRAAPAFATVLPFYDWSVRAGTFDTIPGLAIAFTAIDQPFSLWLLRGFFREIPRELDDAALIDGCTRWQAFRLVILPVVRPGLATAGILTFLLAFQEYTLPLVLTDVNAKTVPVFLTAQLGQTLPVLQQAAAGVTLITVPIIVAAFVVQRHLIAGLATGSLKG